MTFAHPHWLWALALLPLFAALFFVNERRRSAVLRRLVAARLEDRLAGTVSLGKRRARFLLLLLGLACTVVSLAQPRYGSTWQEAQRRGRDILLAIDTSRSMLANDLTPNRLQRAKLAAQDFIDQLQGDRVGLIAFAGTSFLQAPLTADYGAVLTALNELDTEIIPQGGTNIADAIKAAEDAFGKGESEHRALIVFTDGEELDADGIAAAERVRAAIRIFTVGLGSADGTLIPLPQQGGAPQFVQDSNGQYVKSRLDEDRLRSIAEATGGFYVHLLNGPAEMQQIARDGLGAMTEKDIDAKLSRQPIERYQWPLAAGLACLAASMLIGERKRTLRKIAGASAALLLLALPSDVQAKNTGVTAYEKEDYKGAIEAFTKQLGRKPDSEALHFNLGAAAYKAGRYDQALESFARAVTTPDPQLRAKAEYNMGNTLFQRGNGRKERDQKLTEWRGSLQHYEEALKVDPKDANAEYNRDLVKKMIEELEKQPPQSDQQKKKDKKKDKKDGGKNKDEQPSEGDEQKDGEPQEGDGEKSGKGKKKEGESGDKEEQDKDSKEGKDGEKKDQKDGKGEKPEPTSEQEGKKKEGELQAAPEYEKDKADPAEQEAADAAAAAEGKMTEQQAIVLLESLKAEDDRVQIRERTERKVPERFFPELVMDTRSESSGEHTRPACWSARPATTNFFVRRLGKSSAPRRPAERFTGCGALAEATPQGSSFRRDAETNTRDAYAIRTSAARFSTMVAILCGLLLFLTTAHSQVGVKATLSNTTPAVGEAVQLQLQCTGTGRAPQPPAVQVEGLDIRYLGPSTQMQIVNGVVSASVTHVYQVIPMRAGVFTIPPIDVEVEGQRFRTAALSMNVGAAPPAGQVGTQQPMDKIAFAEIVLPKTTAYVGEALPSELRLYVDSRVSRQLEQMPILQGEGFTKTKLLEPRQEIARRDGREYMVFVFRTAITPSKAGKIAIGPVDFQFIAQIPRAQRNRQRSVFDMFDDVIGSSGAFAANQRVTQRAEAVVLDVRPLPVQGRPADFSGAVGEFQFSAEGSPGEVKVGDPVTMRMRVSGRGSFDRVAAPTLTDAAGWRSYPASQGTFQPADDIAMNGTKTFEMAVIPEQTQTAMPQFQFSYFDPAAEKYVTLQSQPAPLRVTGAAPPPPPPVPQSAASADAPDSGAATSFAPKAADIHGLHYELGAVRPSFAPLHTRRSFLLAQLLPLAALLFLIGRRVLRRSDLEREHAALRGERETLRRRLRGESAHAPFFDTAARLIQIETALRTGRLPGSVDASAACQSRPLDPATAERVAEIFNARAELLYAGHGRGVGRVSPQERDRVLTTIEKFSSANGQA